MVTIPEPARSELQGLLAQADQAAARMHELEGRQGSEQVKYDTIGASLGFRERYLGGHFGGDKQRLARYREAASDLAKLKRDISEQRTLIASLTEQIRTLVHTELRKNTKYLPLFVACDDAEAANKATQELHMLVEDARNEIGEASRATITGDTYIVTQEAIDTIAQIKAFIPDFLAIMRHFQLNDEVLRNAPGLLEEFSSQLDTFIGATDFNRGSLLLPYEVDICIGSLNLMVSQIVSINSRILTQLKQLRQKRDASVDEAITRYHHGT